MAHRGQPRKRDLAGTRQALLNAAREEVRQHRAGLSLDAVARSAGVSKGGLLHHFPSKDEMFLAVVGDIYERFSADVDARLAEEPAGPGRSMRAYVHAVFDDLDDPGRLIEHGILLKLLQTVPAVSAFADDELARWYATISDDGIAPEVVRLVTLAIDGASVGMLTGQASVTGSLRGLEQNLIALIDGHEAATALLRPHQGPVTESEIPPTSSKETA